MLWSKIRGKYVIIDFGKTMCIKEIKGQFTPTSCEGTDNYMSEPMKAIPRGETRKIDLYSNDIHACNVIVKEVSEL
jgi:hypothetical protein